MEGIDYSPEAVEEVRENLAHLRNEYLDRGQMDWAIILSHTLVYLSKYQETL